MKTVAFVGAYSPLVICALEERLNKTFRCIQIPDSSGFDRLSEVDYLVLRGPKMNAALLDGLGGRLKLIQRWGVGFDGVDIKRAGELGIAVAITGGVNANAVSELAVGLMLALYRHLISYHNALCAGVWDRQVHLDQTYELKGKTVGLIGCGNIGRLVARKVQAFDARVIYYDPFRLPLEQEASLGLQYVEQEALIAQADIISLHMPATKQTERMVDRAFLKRMKPGAVLINTARGSIIDEQALCEALRDHIIWGAGLDAFFEEPIAADHPLLGLPNVIATPHVGGNTVDMNDAMIERVVQNILAIDRGEPLPRGDLVNGAYLV